MSLPLPVTIGTISTTTLNQPAPAMSIFDRIMLILGIGLKVASGVVGGPVGTALSVAQGLEQIALHANAAYIQAVGQPIDMTKVPPETTV